MGVLDVEYNLCVLQSAGLFLACSDEKRGALLQEPAGILYHWRWTGPVQAVSMDGMLSRLFQLPPAPACTGQDPQIAEARAG